MNMIKTIALALALGSQITAVNCVAQNLQLTADSKGRLGYADQGGNVVIPCSYTYAEPFNENGLAKVGKGKKYGLIKTDGSFALPMEYYGIDDLRDGGAVRVQKKSGYGLIDSQSAKVILEPVYTYISAFNCYGLAWLEDGGSITESDGKELAIKGNMGIVDRQGNILIKPDYKGLLEFSKTKIWGDSKVNGDGLVLEKFSHYLSDTLKTDCKYVGYSSSATATDGAGILDQTGNIIVPMGQYSFVSRPAGGMVRFWTCENTNTMYGYYNPETKQSHVCNTTHSELKNIKKVTHTDYVGNLAAYDTSSGWCFIDKKFNVPKTGFKSVKYQKGTPEPGEYLAGIAPGATVIYKSDGTQLMSGTTYDNVNLPDSRYGSDQNFAVCKAGKWGLCDANGNMLIAPKYEYLTTSIYGIYYNKMGGKWGAVDNHGKVLVPNAYYDVRMPKASNPTNVWCTNADSVYTNVNVKTGTAKGLYRYVYAFEDNLAAVNPVKSGTKKQAMYTNKYIMVDTNDNVVFSFPFPATMTDEIKKFVLYHNGNPTKSQQKSFMLKHLDNSERYDLGGIVPEKGWDY